MITTANKIRVSVFILASALIYAIVNIVITGNWWLLLLIYFIANFNGMLAGNIGFHRYYCHSSFKTSKFKARLLAFWTIPASMLMGPIGFSAIHLHHHKYSDTEKDFISPSVHGVLYISIAGNLIIRHGTMEWNRAVRSLIADPVLKFIEQYYFTLWTLFGIFVYAVSGLFGLVYFFLAPGAFYYLQTASLVNCAGHWPVLGSYRTYDTKDNSCNNNWINIFTWGEGLQNNHHHRPGLYNHAMKKGEFDMTAWVIDKFFILKK